MSIWSRGPPSPARALNEGASRARGQLGFHDRRRADDLAGCAAIRHPRDTSVSRSSHGHVGFHLGSQPHKNLPGTAIIRNRKTGCESLDWRRDGYQLFDCHAGWVFQTRVVCAAGRKQLCVRHPKHIFEILGGFDEAFDYPGGGCSMSTLWARAWEQTETKTWRRQLFHHLSAPRERANHLGRTGGAISPDQRPSLPNRRVRCDFLGHAPPSAHARDSLDRLDQLHEKRADGRRRLRGAHHSSKKSFAC